MPQTLFEDAHHFREDGRLMMRMLRMGCVPKEDAEYFLERMFKCAAGQLDNPRNLARLGEVIHKFVETFRDELHRGDETVVPEVHIHKEYRDASPEEAEAYDKWLSMATRKLASEEAPSFSDAEDADDAEGDAD